MQTLAEKQGQWKPVTMAAAYLNAITQHHKDCHNLDTVKYL